MFRLKISSNSSFIFYRHPDIKRLTEDIIKQISIGYILNTGYTFVFKSTNFLHIVFGLSGWSVFSFISVLFVQDTLKKNLFWYRWILLVVTNLRYFILKYKFFFIPNFRDLTLIYRVLFVHLGAEFRITPFLFLLSKKIVFGF